MKSHRERKCILGSPPAVIHESSAKQITREMAVVALPIVFLFLLTEVPIVAISYVFLSLYVPSDPGDGRTLISTHNDCLTVLNYLIPTTFMVSSSYTIFCFLMSNHYRRTLKILSRAAYDRLTQIFKPRSYSEVQTMEMVRL